MKKRKFISVTCLVLMLFSICGQAALATVNGVPIVSAGGDQSRPAIYINKVVWEDGRNGNLDIYMCNLDTNEVTAVYVGLGDQSRPSIFGNKIVWQDKRSGNWDIYMYDLDTGTATPICTAPGDQVKPHVYGNTIVWEDQRNGNWDIYSYNLVTTTETPLAVGPVNQLYNAISGNKVVWLNNNSQISDYSIYVYDLSNDTTTRLFSRTRAIQNVSFFEDKILWMDWRYYNYANNNFDIFMYNLTSSVETQITTAANAQDYPAGSGSTIVWHDKRNGTDWNIWAYNLSNSTDRSVSIAPGTQAYPAAYGNKIVWADARSGNYDIYTNDTTPPNVSSSHVEGTYNTVQSVTLTSTEPGTIYYTTDGSMPTAVSPQYTTPISIAATTTLKFMAVDDVGNVSAVQTRKYVYDATLPNVTVAPAPGTYSSNQYVGLLTDEPGTIYYSLNGTDWLIYSTPVMVDSTVALQVYAKDMAGNQSSTETFNYVYDSDPIVTANPAPGIYSAAQNVSLSTSEPSTIYYSSDGIQWQIYSTPVALDSTVALQVYSIDDLENQSATQTLNYCIDNSPPAANATPVPGAYRSAQQVGLTADEPGTIYYSFNGTDWLIYSTPVMVESTVALQVYAKDIAGNQASTQTLNYVVDTVPPTVTAAPEPATYSVPQSVTLTANESATVYYKTGGTSWQTYSSPITVNSTTSLQVYAADTAGNTSGVKNLNYVIESGGGGGGSVPATPVELKVHLIDPETETFGAVVNPSGAILDTNGQEVQMNIPTGAVSNPTQITIMQVAQGELPPNTITPAGAVVASSVYEFGPSGTVFNLPITISLKFDPSADIDYDVAPYYLNESTGLWELMTGYTVDSVTHKVTFPTNHFSIYTLMAIKPNKPPVAKINGPYKGVEGSVIEFDASGSFDPDGDVLKYRWDFNNDGVWDTEWSTSYTESNLWEDNWSGKAVVEVSDGNLYARDTADVLVDNANPVIGYFNAPLAQQRVTEELHTSIEFTDTGINDTHTAFWDWGDGTSSTGVVNELNGSGTAAGSHIYEAAGVYTLKVTVTDKDGGPNTSTYQYIVVYDPNAGFVTGGGWLNSPEGASAANPELTGKAKFGFVSKYQKGSNAPTGQIEFQFKEINFRSTSYEWLVIAGSKAQFKGIGTINGSGNYGFMLIAIDGQVNGGGGDDKFRIKIWDKNNNDAIVYDNLFGADDTADPATVVGGGSVVIHKKQH